MKYIVLGKTQVTVSVEVEANDPADAMKKAKDKFKGVNPYYGNGGPNKLIGVEGPGETIAADYPVIFYDYRELK